MQALDTNGLTELRRRNDGLQLINVLSRACFHQGHIPGSVNIPLTDADFVARVESLISGRHAPVVVYCAGEECDASEKAATKLEKAGFRRVYDYAGGMQAWQNAGQLVQAGICAGGLS
jgi:rhodanese-related sulfurtransferase